MEEDLIRSVNQQFSLEISTLSYGDLKLILAKRINEWINNDFSMLIHVLYRIDVSEKKINELLRENIREDAANILADLVIERELQKIEARKQSPRPGDISNEEKW